MSLNVLVTGGAGFLGSNLIDRLLAQRHKVTVLDNLQTGRLENLAHLPEGAIRFIQGDVRDPFPEPEQGAWGQIYHLACPASPPRYQADPVGTFLIAAIGTLNALEAATKAGCRVLIASTSEVYGDPEVHPQTESYRGAVNPIGPRACYDEGKRGGETLAFDYHRARGTDIAVVRIFNTYGPRMDPADGRVVSNFIVQALKGEPITLYGGGTQSRSFCYVDDLVEGLLRMMATPGFTGPVNLGNPNEFTVKELAEVIGRVLGKELTFEDRPLPQDDPLQRQPVIAVAAEKLGWAPTVQLEEGISRAAAWFQESLKL